MGENIFQNNTERYFFSYSEVEVRHLCCSYKKGVHKALLCTYIWLLSSQRGRVIRKAIPESEMTPLGYKTQI